MNNDNNLLYRLRQLINDEHGDEPGWSGTRETRVIDLEDLQALIIRCEKAEKQVRLRKLIGPSQNGRLDHEGILRRWEKMFDNMEF